MPKSIQIKNKQSNTKPNFQDFVFVYFVHDELMIIFISIYLSILKCQL